MLIERRDLLRASAILAAAGILPAGLDLSARANAASRLQMGEFTVQSINDGSMAWPLSFILPDVPTEDVKALLGEAGITENRLLPDCNVTLVTTPNAKIIFDVGAG